jgi:diaminopimelate decarboxylase
MPITPSFQARLYPHLETIAQHFGTPFHIYDELGIRQTCQALKQAFSVVTFREFFAVKALPNPHILQIIRDEGFGFDCSSLAELVLSRQVGARATDIFFTSNNTTPYEFGEAFAHGGAILNLDDITLIDKLPLTPETICFRYNPGARRSGNAIIGNPIEAKFGVAHDQIESAYRLMRDKGVKRFGLHTMIVSNERNHEYLIETAHMLLQLAESLQQSLDIRFEFLNLGGGLGIPYRPEDAPLDLQKLAHGVVNAFQDFAQRNGNLPHVYFESGRYITGNHGVLVTRAINHKHTYRHYIGVDANMSALMRPGMYGAYHHIDVLNKDNAPIEVVDIVGSLCENNDKFAIQRPLPHIDAGDLLVIHDTGAHGSSMGFNYNGKLRPQELLLQSDGTIRLIRRAETLDDYFATLRHEPHTLTLGT